MDLTTFMPIIVQATKFVFDEVGAWIDDVRQRSKNAASEPVSGSINIYALKLIGRILPL